MTSRRFLALDSWRGLCAILVALTHLHSAGVLGRIPLRHNAWLFVDFFFVLSGFVISCGYGSKLEQGLGVGRFMALRLARLYPLHLATLLLVLAIGIVQGTAFHRADQSAAALLANLLFVHALGLFGTTTWNQPSWSISAEFYTYLLFALTSVALTPRRLGAAATGAVLVLPVVVHFASGDGLAVTYDFGFLRCVYGFSMGVLCWRAYCGLSASGLGIWSRRSATIAELVALCAAVTFVSASRATVAAPYVFSLVVLTFAFERGAISAGLRTAPLLALGAWSYSIYMVHGVVLAALLPAFAFVGLAAHHGNIVEIGGNPLAEVAATVLFIAAVLACSSLTVRWIEIPGRRLLSARHRRGEQRAVEATAAWAEEYNDYVAMNVLSEARSGAEIVPET